MSHTFFEGPEKKVELTVASGHPSLRELGEAFWRGVVRAARAEVLSVLRNEHLDAYLLSESSLFVYDRGVTMITCGQTTLVDAVQAMLAKLSVDAIEVLVYERKHEHFPDEQPSRFAEDGQRLHAWVPGRALRFGAEREHAVWMFHSTREHRPGPDDRTLEILMHGIDPRCAERFRGSLPRGGLARELGLDLALRGHTIDEHGFEPAGYSLNAIRGAAYTTLHVTPQRLGSYVSFETNAADFAGHLPALVAEVVGLFAPSSFDVVVFAPDDAASDLALDGYVVREHVREPVCGYQVTFRHFFRDAGRSARALEIPLT